MNTTSPFPLILAPAVFPDLCNEAGDKSFSTYGLTFLNITPTNAQEKAGIHFY